MSLLTSRFDDGDIILNTASGGQVKLMNQLELIDSQLGYESVLWV